ncbi:MAG: hypothetical protein E7Z86_04295 [Methanosphaera stadtmanae]|jgi:hypothetical protein|nr:hypothetical protein [Methanosphaera stadtmanae]
MTDDFELINSAVVEDSMIRKIGDNQYLKIIPSERIVQISTIEQKKITEPIKQTDEVIINAYPQEVKLYKNENQDNKYETKWVTTTGESLYIPLSDIKTMHSLLQAKDVIDENILNLSNVLSMIIKQNTLKEKLETIKEEI